MSTKDSNEHNKKNSNETNKPASKDKQTFSKLDAVVERAKKALSILFDTEINIVIKENEEVGEVAFSLQFEVDRRNIHPVLAAALQRGASCCFGNIISTLAFDEDSLDLILLECQKSS